MLKKYALIFLIILSGLGLRLHKLDTNSFWYDEAESVITAAGAGRAVSVLSKENYPGIFYKIFIHYWSRLGQGEGILRLSSVIFGVLSIVMVYILAAYLFGRPVALLSALLISFSPFHIYYSQELRMYAFLSFLSALCVYFFIRALKEKRIIFYFSYVILNVLNIYTHPVAFIWLLCQFLFFFLFRKRYAGQTKAWLWANLAISFFLIPWFTAVFRLSFLLITKHPRYYDIVSWILPVNSTSLAFTFKNFSVGYNAESLFYIFASVVFFFLFLRGITKIKREERTLSLLCILIPICISFLVSVFRNCYVDRYFIASSIFFYIIIANGIYSLNRKFLCLAVTGLMLVNIPAVGAYFDNELTKPRRWRIGIEARKGYRDAAFYILKNMRAGDIVFHTCRNTLVPFKYYFHYRFKDAGRGMNTIDKNNFLLLRDERGKLQAFKFLIPYYGLEKINEETLYLPERIWLVFSEWHFGEKDIFELPEWRVVQGLDKEFARKSFSSFRGIDIYLYEKK